MKNKLSGWKLLMLIVVGYALIIGVSVYLGWDKFIVLDAKGPVAEVQQKLIMLTGMICMAVVIPVIGLLVFIVWRYRDTPNNKAPYQPHWDDSKLLETIWWGIPIVIIIILGVVTARDTYKLAKPPVSDSTPITIQVTSLDWKWLFQYPDQKIATVNYVQIPAGVPVRFQLTSDAPMNSFWIPQLGGQEYSMPGMAMQLWLQADKPGTYYGSGANFSGRDFAKMNFVVESKPQADFNTWVKEVKSSSPKLTNEGYTELAKPSTMKQQFYSDYPATLYTDIVNKNGGIYMKHGSESMSSGSYNGSTKP
ncbi:cytochrome aa3-600 menaquinol oxidase subunit 2 [Paenibacillus shirakamiensis]|uniref:Quinol oxidase subunit 2 n=1 Tax=Paenibacillus shirakamiensis TaxID=1265935 RepID=A0ABS4JJD7_9BACL|nr:cytochrome c oxidase subunit II transmembrane domain-containing protein [Paenibacillus shirakamiensis]MBP2000729.1 cytochrome aa3-600 menaquinol oxidase subunit 2 [Paenibacillus shirakamiensis]